jgi:hypothetical protein
VKQKKIRGLRRRQKELNRWRGFHKELNTERLRENGYVYAKAKFGPWANLFTETPYPSGYRKQLFSNLIEFYFNWKRTLDKDFEQYYLKIWLFYPRFIDSQVVAAIGDKVEYYESLFGIEQQEKAFPVSAFNHELANIARFDWQTSIDEDYYSETEFTDVDISTYRDPKDYYADQRFYRSLLEENVPFGLIKNEQTGKEERLFRKKRGGLWIGEVKK